MEEKYNPVEEAYKLMVGFLYEGKKYYMKPLNSYTEISGIGKVSGAVCYQNIVWRYHYQTRWC